LCANQSSPKRCLQWLIHSKNQKVGSNKLSPPTDNLPLEGSVYPSPFSFFRFIRAILFKADALLFYLAVQTSEVDLSSSLKV
jgi:hypothetical protein